MNSTARGLILRETNVGESNKILTILIKDAGKISCTAKGCRKQKSRLFSCSSMFCYGDFVINYSGKYPVIEQAVSIENFYYLRTDLDCLAYGTYITEIIERTTPEGINANESMLLILKALQKLNAHKNPLLVCSVFTIKLLQIYGYVPCLDGCSVCGKPTDIFTAEGFVCEKCIMPNTQYIKISQGAVECLQYIISGSIKDIFSLVLEDDLLSEIYYMSEFLFKHHIDLHFKSYEFIKKLGNLHI